MDHRILSSPEDRPWNRPLCLSFFVLLGLSLAFCIAINDMFGFLLLIINFMTFYCLMWCMISVMWCFMSTFRAKTPVNPLKSAKLALAVLSLVVAMTGVFVYWVALADMPQAVKTVLPPLVSLPMTAAFYAFFYYIKRSTKSSEASSEIYANPQKCDGEDDDDVVQMLNLL